MTDEQFCRRPETLDEKLRRWGQLQRELDRLAAEIRAADSSVMSRSRGCKTPGCPGRGKVWKRKDRIDHTARRIECPICKLRWSSTERMVAVSIEQTGPHSMESAIRNLAAWKEQQQVSSNPLIGSAL